MMPSRSVFVLGIVIGTFFLGTLLLFEGAGSLTREGVDSYTSIGGIASTRSTSTLKALRMMTLKTEGVIVACMLATGPK